MTIFYLVRHAHANWMPDESRPLSERGLSDAQRVADVLHQFPIRVICSSPYRRAYQTVEPCAKRLNLSITILADLRERQLAGKPVENFAKAIEAVWHNPSFAHPGGESNIIAQQRGVVVVKQLKQQHPIEDIVLATHGNLMALILQYFDPTVGYEWWKSLRMPDIYRLNLNDKPLITGLWGKPSSS